MKKLVVLVLGMAVLVGAGLSFKASLGSPSRLRLPDFGIKELIADSKIELSGKMAEERRPLSAFSKIELTGSGKLIVNLDAQPGALIKADENILPMVVSEVRGDTLHLGPRPGALFTGGTIVYEISAQSVELVRTSGSGDIEINGIVTGNELALQSEGSGKIRAKVDVKELESRIAGSGDVEVSGTAEDFSLLILGSGNVRGKELSGEKVKANIAGSGNVDLGTYKEIDVNIAGSGDLSYTGNPKLSTRVAGSGKVRSR